MSAKEIIIRLINDKLISGEEAAILFESINRPIYYWPYYKTDYKINNPYELSKTNEAPWWQDYQLTANKDLGDTGVSSTTGLCDTKPWTENCDN